MKKLIFAAVTLILLLCTFGIVTFALSNPGIREIRVGDSTGLRVSVSNSRDTYRIMKLLDSDTEAAAPNELPQNSISVLVFHANSECDLYTIYEGVPAAFKESISQATPGEWLETDPYVYGNIMAMNIWDDAFAGVTVG